LPLLRAVAQHDQYRRDKAIGQHLDIAPFSRVVQALQAAVCRYAQARHRRSPPPARHAETNRGDPQHKRGFRRHVRKMDGGQRQYGHHQQQQPQAA